MGKLNLLNSNVWKLEIADWIFSISTYLVLGPLSFPYKYLLYEL